MGEGADPADPFDESQNMGDGANTLPVKEEDDDVEVAKDLAVDEKNLELTEVSEDDLQKVLTEDAYSLMYTGKLRT
jgi:hypothetical protein